MKRILIIGGSYFLGRHFLESADALKYDLVVFNRGNSLIKYKQIYYQGDRNKASDLKLVFDDNFFDIIVDFCGYNKKHMDVLLSFKQHYKTIIFISTGSVYTNMTTKCKETDIIEEKHNNAYEQGKYAAEMTLIKSGVDYIILRPSLIFGEYDYNMYADMLMRQIIVDKRIVLPNKLSEMGIIQPIYVGQVVDMINFFLIHDYKRGIYNIGGPILSIREYIDIICECCNVNPKNVQLIDTPEYAMVAKKLYRIPINNKLMIDSKLVEEISGQNISSYEKLRSSLEKLMCNLTKDLIHE